MRIAVLGCGSIGRRLITCLQHLEQTDLLAYDPSPSSRQLTTEQTGLSCSSSVEDVWQGRPDAVLVTAPSPFHIQLARQAVAHGCDVFVEKPLANTLDGVDDLIEDAGRAKTISMVGCNMRFHPGPAAVKALLQSGRIGTVLAARLETGSYLPDWRPLLDFRQSISARTELGGGVLLECIHEVDLSLWLFGPGHLVGAALKKADSLNLNVDGVAEMLIVHDDGVLSSVHLNFVQRNYHRTCQVIGTEGTLSWNFGDPWVELRTSTVERLPFAEKNDPEYMYRAELAYFLGCVRSRSKTCCDLKDGRRALEIALGARNFSELSIASAARRRIKMTTTAIIQARMSSTRLPGKVLADIEGRSMLVRVVEQVKLAGLVDRVTVATSSGPADDDIAAACVAMGVACFRGSEDDVLDRYYRAALWTRADVIVRLTADCPLLDPSVIDKCVASYRDGAFDYVSNTVYRTYPDGLDVEVFSFEALERAWKESRWKSEREHVTPFIWKHPEIFRLGRLTHNSDRSDLRWTVDRQEDLEFVRCIYRRLAGRAVSMGALLEVLSDDQDLARINAGIECNEGYRKSIGEDEPVGPHEVNK